MSIEDRSINHTGSAPLSPAYNSLLFDSFRYIHKILLFCILSKLLNSNIYRSINGSRAQNKTDNKVVHCRRCPKCPKTSGVNLNTDTDMDILIK